MLVVYPFVHSPCADLEILLSVRTLPNLPGITGVVIVGDIPKTWGQILEFCGTMRWDLIRIAPEGRGKTPVADVIRKAVQACRAFAEDFLFMHDDCLVLKPVAVISHEHHGPLIGPKSGYWAVVAKRTMGRLKGGGHLLFECHTPIIINPERFLPVFEGPVQDVYLKSLYLNQPGVKEYNAGRLVPIVKGANRKMRKSEALTADIIKSYRQKTDFLSLHHVVRQNELEQCLQEGWLWPASTSTDSPTPSQQDSLDPQKSPTVWPAAAV